MQIFLQPLCSFKQASSKLYTVISLIAFVSLTSYSAMSQDTLWFNPITGTNIDPNNTNPYTTGDIHATKISVGGITMGNGLTGKKRTNGFSCSHWRESNIADAQSQNDYIEFELTANTGYTIDFASLQLNWHRSHTAESPKNFALRSSLDGYSSDLTSFNYITTTYHTDNIDLTSLQDVHTVTFRLYGWNGTAGNSSDRIVIFDFLFKGTVHAADDEEEPEVIENSLWSNSITGNNPGQSNPYTIGDIKATGVSVSGIGRSPAVSGQNGNDRYNTLKYSSNNSINTGDYIEFTLTPLNGHAIQFDSLVFTGQRNSTGPTKFALRSSLDNYTASIGSISDFSGTTPFHRNVNLSAAQLQAVEGAITFRLYGWKSNNSGNSEFSINDFNFHGSVIHFLWSNTITGNSINPQNTSPYTTGDNYHSNITVSGITKGNGLTGYSTNDRYNTSHWNGSNINGAYSNNDYYEFTLTADLGYIINFTELEFAGQRDNNSNSPKNFALRSSADNFDSNITTYSFSGTSGQVKTTDLTDADFQSVHSITFRLYGWGGSTSTNNRFSVNDFIFRGDVIAISTLWSNTITGNNINPQSSNPYTTGDDHHNKITVSGITKGSGLKGKSKNDRYYSYDWDKSSFNSAKNGNDYYEFTLTANAGYTMDITGFDYTGERDKSDSPTNFALRSSIDNYGNDIATYSIATLTPSRETRNISTLKDITSITFRLYGWNGDDDDDEGFSINDFAFYGTINEAVYYSQDTGDFEDVLWARARVGTPIAVTNSENATFVVQDTHVVTFSHHDNVHTLVVEQGGEISFAGGYMLSLKGDLEIEGSMTCGNGTIRFYGDEEQELICKSSQTLNNVIIDSNSTVDFPDEEAVIISIKPTGVITVPKGILNTGDNLVLRSTSEGTAAIGTIGNNGAVYGRVTLQRFIPNMTAPPLPGTTGSWIALGTPLVGSTVQQWNETVVTTGFPGSDFPPPGYNFNNIQWYNETAGGDLNNGFTGINHISDGLYADRGYYFYTYANLPSPQNILNSKGTIQQGSFNDTLSYTNTGNADNDGWNLLVNRYPSEVDFKKLATSGNGITSYHLFDAETNNYKVYHTSAVGTAPQYIASGQAFFAQATGSNKYLRYQETSKSREGVAFERSTEEASFAAIRFYKAANSSDECVLNFNDNATADYEYNYDALKMRSQNPAAAECALVSADGELLSIDSRPLADDAEISIPLFVKMPNNGTYRLRIEETANLPFGSCMFIEDLLTGNTIPMEAGQELVITHTGNYSGNRFVIHATPSIHTAMANVTCFGESNGSLEISLPQGNWDIILTDSHGNEHISNGTSFENLSAGDYIISATNAESTCPVSTKEFQITEPAEMVLTILQSKTDQCNVSSNGTIEWKMTNATSYSFTVTNSNGEMVRSGQAGSENVLVEGLDTGIYTVTTESFCGAQSFDTDLTDHGSVSAHILSENINLSILEGEFTNLILEQENQNATEITWTLSNGFTSNEDVFNYEFNEPGEYVLILHAENDHCSADDIIHISVDRFVGIAEEMQLTPVSFIQTANSLELYLNISSREATTVTVFDVNGRKVWNMTTPTMNGKNISIGTGSFADGVYLIKTLIGQTEVLNKKIINRE